MIIAKKMIAKKTYSTILIPLFVVASIFVIFSFAKGFESNSEKSIFSVIERNNNLYKTIKLELTVTPASFTDSFSNFQGKIANGTILSFQGETLAYFSASEDSAPYFCEGEDDCLAEGEFILEIPYFPNGKYADIYDVSGKKVLTIDISSKATCNENDRCDRPMEDSENCPQDCRSGEPKIDPEIIETAKNNIAQLDQKGNFNLIALLAGAAILLIATALGYYFYRRNRAI